MQKLELHQRVALVAGLFMVLVALSNWFYVQFFRYGTSMVGDLDYAGLAVVVTTIVAGVLVVAAFWPKRG